MSSIVNHQWGAELSEPFSEEEQFWSNPPRYSLAPAESLAPAPLAHVPSSWNTWVARLLFAAMSCAVIVLITLEVRSLSGPEPLTLARAVSVLVSQFR